MKVDADALPKPTGVAWAPLVALMPVPGAASLAASMRETGGVRVLLECLDAPTVGVQTSAMALLGNLLTDAFEPGSVMKPLAMSALLAGMDACHDALDARGPDGETALLLAAGVGTSAEAERSNRSSAIITCDRETRTISCSSGTF